MGAYVETPEDLYTSPVVDREHELPFVDWRLLFGSMVLCFSLERSRGAVNTALMTFSLNAQDQRRDVPLLDAGPDIHLRTGIIPA